MRWRLLGILLVLCALNCQSYNFVLRTPQRVTGTNFTQEVTQVVPADILFVIDNSGSMLNQRTELQNNMALFISQLAGSQNNFHFGIVTTDVECNIPDRNCGTGKTSLSCCAIVEAGNLPLCQELDTNNDGTIDWSNCDAGRLRSLQGSPAYFSPPGSTAAEQATWAANVGQVISNLGCQGSGLESGLEAARRALNCAQGNSNCPSANMAQLNAGFLRPEADLVVVFVSDEDDCSFLDPNVYLAPTNPGDPNQQATHLCSPTECYAYYGAKLDSNNDGLQDWADATTAFPYSPLYQCNGTHRSVNPPYPANVQQYIDALVQVKGGDITKVRAAGIVSATQNASATLGYSGDACLGSALGVTNACGCWSANVVIARDGAPPPDANLYCALTQLIGRQSSATPVNTASNECSAVGTGAANYSSPQPGCKAMPGNRYVAFLEALSAARLNAGARSDTLLNSICLQSYETTIYSIVNDIILTNCFEIGDVPAAVDDVEVVLNGNTLTNVSAGSATQGWSWVAGSAEICLEGGLQKNIGDKFNIFVVGATTN